MDSEEPKKQPKVIHSPQRKILKNGDAGISAADPIPAFPTEKQKANEVALGLWVKPRSPPSPQCSTRMGLTVITGKIPQVIRSEERGLKGVLDKT